MNTKAAFRGLQRLIIVMLIYRLVTSQALKMMIGTQSTERIRSHTVHICIRYYELPRQFVFVEIHKDVDMVLYVEYQQANLPLDLKLPSELLVVFNIPLRIDFSEYCMEAYFWMVTGTMIFRR